MLDRASTFDQPEIVELLTDRYVPVALDVWYHERRQDAEGELYRKIISGRKNLRPGRTTQGFYIAKPDGTLLDGWNNRNAERLRKRLVMELSRYEVPAAEVSVADAERDIRYEREIPKGATVVDVSTRIIEADWGDEDASRWQKIHRAAVGHDHLWMLGDEREALKKGMVHERLAKRIAHYHLIDNTRGEPPMWRPSEVELSVWKATKTADGMRLDGTCKLATEDGSRGYHARALGFVRFDGDRLERFDVVFRGTFHGEGRWTSGAPKKPFTLAIAFSLADPKRAATQVPPQAARDLRSYLEPR